MADGAMGWMMYVAGLIAVLSGLVLGAWLVIWLVFAAVTVLGRLPLSVRLILAVLCLCLSAIPPLWAKRYFNESLDDFAKQEQLATSSDDRYRRD